MYSISTNLSDKDGIKWKELCGSRSTTSYKLLKEVIEFMIGSRSSCPCCGGSTVDLDPPKQVPIPVDPVIVDPPHRADIITMKKEEVVDPPMKELPERYAFLKIRTDD